MALKEKRKSSGQGRVKFSALLWWISAVWRGGWVPRSLWRCTVSTLSWLCGWMGCKPGLINCDSLRSHMVKVRERRMNGAKSPLIPSLTPSPPALTPHCSWGEVKGRCAELQFTWMSQERSTTQPRMSHESKRKEQEVLCCCAHL